VAIGVLRVLARPLRDLRAGHCAGLARHFAAAAEQDQRGDAADAVARAQVRLGVGVHLRQAQLRFQLRGGGLEVRRHAAAGPAPRRPEVDQHGQAAGADVAVETGFVQRERLAGEQRLVAAPAGRRLAELVARHALERRAMRAGNDEAAVGGVHPRLLREGAGSG
jgi:hypothetical protein